MGNCFSDLASKIATICDSTSDVPPEVKVQSNDYKEHLSSAEVTDSEKTSISNVPSKLITRPKGLRQLNDSVWELYKPPDGVQKMDIILFHGSQLHNDGEAFWRTWLSRDETIVWPKVWLAKMFPEARILSVSYDSSIRKVSGQMDMYLVMENLIHDIIWNTASNAGQNCPVILAGHCFGGIIIKAFLLKCDQVAMSRNRSRLNAQEFKRVEKLQNFLQNCKAICYYSPPNGGARLVGSLAYRDYISGTRLAEFLNILNPITSRIHQDFRCLQDKFEPRLTSKTIGAQTTWKTRCWDFMKTNLVVPEAAVRQDADTMMVYWVDADHFAASKAKDDSTCMIFTALRDLVESHYILSSSITKDTGEEIAKKLGITFDQLKAANPGVNWKDLKVGQVLKRPGSGSESSISTYKVFFGDNGEDIGKNLGITFPELAATNPGVDWNNLNIDQILKVRGSNFVQIEDANPVNWANLHIDQVLTVRDSGSWATTTYKVVSGDTGHKIAQKFNMTFRQLEALNCNNGTLDVGLEQRQ